MQLPSSLDFSHHPLLFLPLPPIPISYLSMSSLLNLHGMVLATAMAVSGSVILFALCRQRPFSAAQIAVKQNSASDPHRLRSCISSHNKKKREKSKKRVHFALDVVESVIDESSSEEEEEEEEEEEQLLMELEHVRAASEAERQVGKMPANRMALYNGILQDRMQLQLQRPASLPRSWLMFLRKLARDA